MVDLTEGDLERGTKISRDTRTQEQKPKGRKMTKKINSNWFNYTVQVVEKWEISI